VVILNVNVLSVEWCETQRYQNTAKSLKKMLIRLSDPTPNTGNLAMRNSSVFVAFIRDVEEEIVIL
jgi:hypothetical protein